MKVALLGPEGTFTHKAAVDYYGKEIEPVFCSTIKEVFNSELERKLVPFENSLGGGVGETIDLIRQKDLRITGEIRTRISHVVASRSDQIEKVRSHPQALSQCREYIERNSLEEIESSSTAKAAKQLGENEAAICSSLAAEINGLEIVETDVSDNSNNETRFIAIGGEPKKKQKTSLILEPGVDRPGLLSSMLNCFSGHGINLSYIQSRPTKEELGNYYFYVEAEGSAENQDFQKAIKCLETYSKVDVKGSY